MDDLMQSKRGLQLDRVVLLGRTFEEYRRYFLLEPGDLIGKRVLDVAGGVSSFCAEANQLGIKVTSFDPIYSLPPEKSRSVPSRTSNRFTGRSAVCLLIAGAITKIPNTCANCRDYRSRTAASGSGAPKLCIRRNKNRF